MRKILALLGPVLAGISCVFWYLLNRHYPKGESGELAVLSQLTYESYLKEGLSGVFQSLYSNTFLRPIGMALIGLPGWITAQGQVQLAVGLTSVTLYGFFVFFLMRILKKYLKGWKLGMTVLWVSTLWPVVVASRSFTAELPFLASGLAAIHYLWTSEGFKFKWKSFCAGVAVGLALIFQPLEAILYLGFFLLHPLMEVYRLKTRRKKCIPGLALFFLAWACVGGLGGAFSNPSAIQKSDSGLSVLEGIHAAVGPVVWILLLIVGIPGLLKWMKRFRWNGSIRAYLGWSAVALAPAMVSQWFSQSNSFSYTLTGVILTSLAAICFQKWKVAFKHPRGLCIASIGVLYFCLSWSAHPGLLSLRAILHYPESLPSMTSDPGVLLYEKLRPWLDPAQVLKIAIVSPPGTPLVHQDPSILTLLAREDRQDWFFEFPHWNGKTVPEQFLILESHYQWALVGPLPGSPLLVNPVPNTILPDLSSILIRNWKEHRLDPFKYREEDVLKISGRIGRTAEYLLLRIRPGAR